ncbi:hypothetical protein [Nocardioides sp.]|uniref:hypothetical protein n=1 Tax=Nocardioides sp. TaxID=35761 RepID=UPI003D0E83AC
MSEERPLPRIGDYFTHVRRYYKRMLVFGVLGAAIGGALFLQRADEYRATSTVALSPQLTYLSLNPKPEKQPVVTVDTTAALLRSDEALDLIGQSMGLSPQEASDRMIVSAKPLSRVLVIRITGVTSKQAASGSRAAIAALLSLQSEKFALPEDRVRLLRNRVNVLQAAAQEQLTSSSTSQNVVDALEIAQTRLDQAAATNNTRSSVITQPRINAGRPGELIVFVAGGLALGLLFALLSAGVVQATSAPRPAPWERS